MLPKIWYYNKLFAPYFLTIHFINCIYFNHLYLDMFWGIDVAQNFSSTIVLVFLSCIVRINHVLEADAMLVILAVAFVVVF